MQPLLALLYDRIICLLPSNYRRIQMQPLLALLYDRIIASRLTNWAKISFEQTTFQKGKGTLNHIFTLRILISLCKRYNKSLYVGFFDLSKAFDKVSRVELLKSLIKTRNWLMSIGGNKSYI